MTLTLLTVLVFAVAADFREMRISNRLIASGLMMGLALRILGEGGAGIVHFLVNISIPVILLFLLFQLRVIGAGDIKLFSVAGGFLSMRQLLYVILAAFVTAAVIEAAVSEANGGNIRESENTDSFFSDDFNWIFYCSLGVCH